MSEKEHTEEMEIDLLELFKSVMSRLWIVAICFVVCTGLAIFYLVNATPIYETEASLMVEPLSESSNLSNLFSTAAFSGSDNISTELELLNSRSTYRRALAKMDLTRYVNSDGVRYSDFEQPLDYGNLKDKVSYSSVQDTNFIQIKVQDPSPEFAMDFCNALAESFSDTLTEISRNSARSQLEFVQGQIPRVEEELQAATIRLSEFQRDNSVLQLTEESKLLLAKLSYYALVEEPLKQEKSEAEKLIAAFEEAEPGLVDVRLGYCDGEEAAALLEDVAAWFREELLYDVLISTSQSQLQVLSRSQSERYYNLTQMLAEAEVDIENSLISSSTLVDLRYASAVAQYLVADLKLSVLSSEQLALDEELAKLPDIERQITELQAEVQLYQQLSLNLRQMESETAMLEASINENVTSVDAAELPTVPVSPSMLKTVFIGAFLGIFAGVGLAVVLGLVDKTIKNRADLEKCVGSDVPMLGWIPLMKVRKRRGRIEIPAEQTEGTDASLSGYMSSNPDDRRERIVLSVNPMSFMSERYKHIASALIYGRKLSSHHVTVCSPGKSDGKTTTLANIAYALALNGKRVLVVDFDLRVPAVAKAFQVKRSEKGIVDILMGKAKIEDCIRQPFSNLPNLNILGVGRTHIVPSVVLQTDLLENFVGQVNPIYDFIFFDAPPLSCASELMTIARVVPEVFIVTRAGISRTDEVKLLLKDLESCGAHIVGTCLNGLALKETSFGQKGSYGAYGYGYSTNENTENIKRNYVFSPREYSRIYKAQLKHRLKDDDEDLYDAPLAFPHGIRHWQDEDTAMPSDGGSVSDTAEKGFSEESRKFDVNELDSFLSEIENDEDAAGRKE